MTAGLAIALLLGHAELPAHPNLSGHANRPGPLVLAGGGGEGAYGDAAAWSARLYPILFENGDVSGDGRVRIAIISRTRQSDWLPCYFEWLGADEAFNLMLDTPDAADDAGLEDAFRHVDAVFIKGGDQGKYYDLWNNRRIECLIVELWQRGGGVGGTSAGAMSLGEFALTGSTGPRSAELLMDAHHPLLNDESGGESAIHDDFLNLLPATIVDSHVTQRDRLGRLIAVLAKAVEDSGRRDIVGIGLDERTGLVVRGAQGLVIGEGAVTFLRPAAGGVLRREPGKPLMWTGLMMDRLTDGDAGDVSTGALLSRGTLRSGPPAR